MDLDILTEKRQADHRRIVAAVVEEEEQENQATTRQAFTRQTATQQAAVRYLFRAFCVIVLVLLVVFLAYHKF